MDATAEIADAPSARRGPRPFLPLGRLPLTPGLLGIAIAALAVMLAATPARADDDAVLARWIQLGPGSSAGALAAGSYGDAPASRAPTILARAITSAPKCPSLTIDGAPLAMSARFTPDAPVKGPLPPVGNFPVTLCEAVVPPGHEEANIGGLPLKLPVANPKRILVIADTGCRMDGPRAPDGSNQQDCSSPVAFPLRFLATYEALFRPDLVVHVGDYFYRDTDCNNAFPGCNDPASPRYQPWGDNWASWNADLFSPANVLLAAAPWVMVRGNHESCGRGARGWYRLLDPRPYPNADKSPFTCAKGSPYDFSPTYVVPVNGVNLLIHDSSFANDTKVNPATAAAYDADLTGLLGAIPGATDIFVTHKPSFGLIYHAPNNAGDSTEQALFNGGTSATSAFRNGVPGNIALFLSGHIHQFQFVSFSSYAYFAPQLIVGVGGSLLDDDLLTGVVPIGIVNRPAFNDTNYDFLVHSIGGGTTPVDVRRSYSDDEFGFAVLDATEDASGRTTGYNASVHKISGLRSGLCTITFAPRNIDCHF